MNKYIKKFFIGVFSSSALFGGVSVGYLLFAPEKVPVVANLMFANAAESASSNITNSDAKGFAKVFSNIAKQSYPSLVYVVNKQRIEEQRGITLEDLFGIPRRKPNNPAPKEENDLRNVGAGSGFIVDLKNGYIITNNHVVDGAEELIVKTNDNKEYKAKLIGTSKETDVAVVQMLKFDTKNLKEIQFADSDKVEIGDWAIAIGAPLGLTKSLTVGVVSALSRSLGDESFSEFIQTDAAVNPGNSGGPLLNLDAKVVGMNTLIMSSTGNYAGISYAINSNIVRNVAESIIKSGKFSFSYLGIQMNSENQEEDNTPITVTKVIKNSPANKAGIKLGDVIVSIDGEKIADTSDFRRKIALKKPGTTIKIGIKRETKNINLEVQLAEASKGYFLGESTKSDGQSELGIALMDSSAGVVVSGVENKSLAENLGFKKGDIILAINRKAVKNSNNFIEMYKADKKAKKRIEILIERNDEQQLIIEKAK